MRAVRKKRVRKHERRLMKRSIVPYWAKGKGEIRII